MADVVRALNEENEKPRYEFFIGVLALISLLIVLLLYLDLADWFTRPLLIMDLFLNFLFLLDFFRSLRRAENRRHYFFRFGWLDLISCIPVPPFLRLARLVRLFRASRNLRHMGYQGVIRGFLSNRAESSLLGAGVLAILLVLVSSAIIVPVESEAAGANITTGEDAIWWAFVTITTVGYGDYFPVTDTGRFVAAIVMTVGVGLFGVLTSYLSTNFLAHDQGVDQAALEAEVRALREDIAAVREMLENRINN